MWGWAQKQRGRGCPQHPASQHVFGVGSLSKMPQESRSALPVSTQMPSSRVLSAGGFPAWCQDAISLVLVPWCSSSVWGKDIQPSSLCMGISLVAPLLCVLRGTCLTPRDRHEGDTGVQTTLHQAGEGTVLVQRLPARAVSLQWQHLDFHAGRYWCAMCSPGGREAPPSLTQCLCFSHLLPMLSIPSGTSLVRNGLLVHLRRAAHPTESLDWGSGLLPALGS